MKDLLTTATLTIAMLAGAPAVYAQSQTAPESAQTDQSADTSPVAADTAQTSFDDKQLRKFVDAQDAINEVRDEYMAKIEEAGSPEDARKLQIEANDKMVSEIKDAGLDIPTYNEIATAYNSEPSVRDRVNGLM